MPFTVIVEEAVSANGADNAVRAGGGVISVLDDVFKGEAETAAAAGEEASGVGGAINGAGALDMELEPDAIHGAPLEEGFLDGFAFGVVADGAAALVTVVFGDVFGFG